MQLVSDEDVQIEKILLCSDQYSLCQQPLPRQQQSGFILGEIEDKVTKKRNKKKNRNKKY